METLKHTNNASKNAMKLLLSVSAFSAVLLSFSSSSSSSSLLVPFFVNALNDIYASAFSKQSSFSSTLEKNVVFLLCNGLLVVIFKNSVTLAGTSKNDNPRVTETTNSGQVVVYHEVSDGQAGNNVLVTVEREEEILVEEMDEQERSGKELVVIEDCKEEEEEEEEEEAIVELIPSPEEFNKKCDDFIRRVKEEIKLGGL